MIDQDGRLGDLGGLIIMFKAFRWVQESEDSKSYSREGHHQDSRLVESGGACGHSKWKDRE
jgi:hypothetical protein